MLSETLWALALLAPLCAITLFLGARRGFFHYEGDSGRRDEGVHGVQLVWAFVIYLVVGQIIVPLGLAAVGLKSLMLLGSAVSLILLGWMWHRVERPPLERPVWRELLYGATSWIVAWPAVTLLGTLLGLLLYLGGIPIDQGEQLPIEQLRETLRSVPSASIMIFSIVVLAPTTEELFFRGFLQGWLRKRLGRQSAIALAALVFSLLHYAPSQMYANLLIVPVVWGIGWFLGHLFEQRRTLWAPIALHALYNTLGVLHEILTFDYN